MAAKWKHSSGNEWKYFLRVKHQDFGMLSACAVYVGIAIMGSREWGWAFSPGFKGWASLMELVVGCWKTPSEATQCRPGWVTFLPQIAAMTTTPRLPTGLETTGARRITVGTCCSVSALGMAEGNGNVRDTRPCTPPALVRGTSWHGTEGRGGGMPRFDRLGLEVGLFHPNSSISESCLGKISKEGQSSEDAPCLCVCGDKINWYLVSKHKWGWHVQMGLPAESQGSKSHAGPCIHRNSALGAWHSELMFELYVFASG